MSEHLICVWCNKPTVAISGNPNDWAIYFPELDGTGIDRAHHVGCLMERLQKIIELQAENAALREQRDELRECLKEHWKAWETADPMTYVPCQTDTKKLLIKAGASLKDGE